MHEMGETLPILGWPQVERRHQHKLFAAIAVVRDSSLVDRKEAEALPIDNPHRHGVALKEQAEGFFTAPCLCDILVRSHPPAISHRPVNNGNVTPIAQPIYGLIWLVYRYFTESIHGVVFVIVRRVSAGNSMLQNRAKRRTRFCLFVIQSV